ncbi:hypothetical protein [Sphingomonas sp. Leaf37]|uniref:hypothetical protein n=1 Tax=Sphingomonas sp. Leaf37 TaxID=2876552 RepID=UPI001E3B8842|nr:hypothetical protein [Sphingomonas sp. Leaf37]
MLEQPNASPLILDRMVQRAELYAAGYNDAEIASQQNSSAAVIGNWRRFHGLPSHRPHGAVFREALAAARLSLYHEGLNDTEVAKRLGTSADAIRKWRGVRGLATNCPANQRRESNKSLAMVTPDLRRRALALLERGVGGRLIAREMNTSLKTLSKWRTLMLRERPELRREQPKGSRKAPRHPGGKAYSKMLPHRRARAFVLYADGLDDGQIARELCVKRQQIWEWRNALFLPAIVKPRSDPASKRKRQAKRYSKPVGPAISPMSNPLYAHIASSIGRGIAPDLLDDAVSDMWLAIAEGRLSVEQVAGQASRYRNKVVASYASRFGTRSLDEEIGDGDGFRMIDMLKDDRSSDWLEEMGASVW